MINTFLDKAEKLEYIAEVLRINQDVHKRVSEQASELMSMASLFRRSYKFGVAPCYDGSAPGHFEVIPVAKSNCWVTTWGENNSISWPDDGINLPEEGEELLCVSWPTGAYSMSAEYPSKTFAKFFDEVKRLFPPKYSDSHNHCLYYAADNAASFMAGAEEIWAKHKSMVSEEIRMQKIRKAEKELEDLRSLDRQPD